MCKEVSECSVRVWQGSKCSKPQCDGSGLPGRSVTVYEMLIIIQVLHTCLRVVSLALLTGREKLRVNAVSCKIS